MLWKMLGECHGRLMFINTLWNDNLCQGLVLLSLPSFRKRLNKELLLGVDGLGLIVRLFWWCPEVRRTQIVIEHEHQSKRFKPAVLWWSRSWEYIAKREQSWILIGSEWLWLGCELACCLADRIPVSVVFKLHACPGVFTEALPLGITLVRCYTTVPGGILRWQWCDFCLVCSSQGVGRMQPFRLWLLREIWT